MTQNINWTGNTGVLDNTIISVANGLTAKVGGGQGTAVTAAINRYTTVTSAADSATLPLTTGNVGLTLTIINAAAANSMNVFPGVGESINVLGANTAFALTANKSAEFYCTNTGQWHSILTA